MPQCLIFWWILLLLILLHCMLSNGQYYFSTTLIFNSFTNKYVLALTFYRKQWLKCALCYLNYRLVKIMACLMSPSLYYYHMKSLPSFGGHPSMESILFISLQYILNFLNWIEVIIYIIYRCHHGWPSCTQTKRKINGLINNVDINKSSYGNVMVLWPFFFLKIRTVLVLWGHRM